MDAPDLRQDPAPEKYQQVPLAWTQKSNPILFLTRLTLLVWTQKHKWVEFRRVVVLSFQKKTEKSVLIHSEET